jgi:hypothetical protein
MIRLRRKYTSKQITEVKGLIKIDTRAYYSFVGPPILSRMPRPWHTVGDREPCPKTNLKFETHHHIIKKPIAQSISIA